jgi:hypothetical protein
LDLVASDRCSLSSEGDLLRLSSAASSSFSSSLSTSGKDCARCAPEAAAAAKTNLLAELTEDRGPGLHATDSEQDSDEPRHA